MLQRDPQQLLERIDQLIAAQPPQPRLADVFLAVLQDVGLLEPAGDLRLLRDGQSLLLLWRHLAFADGLVDLLPQSRDLLIEWVRGGEKLLEVDPPLARVRVMTAETARLENLQGRRLLSGPRAWPQTGQQQQDHAGD